MFKDEDVSVSRIVIDFFVILMSLAIILAVVFLPLEYGESWSFTGLIPIGIVFVIAPCYIGTCSMIVKSAKFSVLRWIVVTVTPFMLTLHSIALAALAEYQSFSNAYPNPYIGRRIHIWSYPVVFKRIVTEATGGQTAFLIALFLVSALICFILGALREDRLSAFFKRIGHKFSKTFFASESDLEILLRLACLDRISMNAVKTYIISMPVNEESKRELEEAMDDFSCYDLFHLYVNIFYIFFSKKDYVKYRKKHVERFGNRLPARCTKMLDKAFGLVPEEKHEEKHEEEAENET